MPVESVTIGEKVRVIYGTLFTGAMFALLGHWRLGGGTTMAIVKVQVPTLPTKSVAEQSTVWLPAVKVEPEVALQ